MSKRQLTIAVILGTALSLVVTTFIALKTNHKTSEVIAQTAPAMYPLGETNYFLIVTPIDTGQNTRDLWKIELWQTLTNGYKIREGVCFTESGTIKNPENVEDSDRYHDDWRVIIDRKINDAIIEIGLFTGNSDNPQQNLIFACSS